MPFTLAHTVVALPFRKIRSAQIPIAGIVIGSMTPDLFRIIDSKIGLQSHTFGSIFHLNLALGLAFSLLWYVLYRPTLYTCFGLQDSLNMVTWHYRFKFFILLCCCIMLGSFTHIVWDGFTHFDQRTLVHADFLARSISVFGHNYSAYFLLQMLSSFIPLPFIYLGMKRYFQKHQAITHTPQILRRMTIIALILTLCISTWYVFEFLSPLSFEMYSNHAYYFTGRIFNKFTQASLVCFTLYCLLYQFYLLKNKF